MKIAFKWNDNLVVYILVFYVDNTFCEIIKTYVSNRKFLNQ